MIPEETKTKFLEEMERHGNISIACAKVGFSRATLYRWKEEDKGFKKRFDRSARLGRESMCDLAEQGLLLLLKDKNLPAIKYVLAHNSPRYKPRYDSKVVLEHRSPDRDKGKAPAFTLEDVVDRMYNNAGEALPPVKKDTDAQNPTPIDRTKAPDKE